MKLLRINETVGEYLAANGEFIGIDKISKEDLLRLVNLILESDDATMDAYDDKTLKNQAQQVIYKSVVQKLSELANRRQEFIDASARLFLEDYEKYKE